LYSGNAQGANSVAIGLSAAASNQGAQSIAIGTNAATNIQGQNAVAIGTQAGQSLQNNNSVAIGTQAGQTNLGVNSIAIGYQAGTVNQANNSIILNASGTDVQSTTTGLFIAPIRNVAGAVFSIPLSYNTTTKEVTYGWAVSTFAGLPTAASAGVGARAFVTDCVTVTFNSLAGGSGGGKVPVFSDGTNWRVG
jgi:hypothetical protein